MVVFSSSIYSRVFSLLLNVAKSNLHSDIFLSYDLSISNKIFVIKTSIELSSFPFFIFNFELKNFILQVIFLICNKEKNYYLFIKIFL
jgi:hypothetical protein